MLTLQEYISNACASDEDATFYNGYSGRGMYGAHCVGVVGSRAAVMRVIGEVIKELARDTAPTLCFNCQAPDDSKLSFDDAVDMLMCYSEDSMGLDRIYYWERIVPVGCAMHQAQQG